jgi:putative ABC transport system ATP-binding protein
MKAKLPFGDYDESDFIHLDEVTKIYQKGKIRVLALNELNLSIKQGEVIAIFGPSGSGKTTLLNLIGGLDSPSSGKIIVGGLPVHELGSEQLNAYRREHVGFIFQTLNLYPTLTVTENIFHQAQLVSDQEELVLLEHVETLVERLGLNPRKNHLPEALSGGEQQRVAIGMALVKNPSIVIADEPTGELDTANTKKIIQLVGEVKAEFPQTTFIVVSHNPAWQEIADHVYFLENGEIKRHVGMLTGLASPEEDEFPDTLPLAGVMRCPQCNSYNVQIILRSPNKLQVGEKYSVINGIVMCNDCAASNAIAAKIPKEGYTY